MTDPLRTAAQALDKLQTAVEAYANAPSLVLLGKMRETFATLRAALSATAALQARIAELEARQVPEGWVALPPGKVAEYLTSRATCAATEARLAEYGVIVHTAAPSKPEAPDPTP